MTYVDSHLQGLRHGERILAGRLDGGDEGLAGEGGEDDVVKHLRGVVLVAECVDAEEEVEPRRVGNTFHGDTVEAHRREALRLGIPFCRTRVVPDATSCVAHHEGDGVLGGAVDDIHDGVPAALSAPPSAPDQEVTDVEGSDLVTARRKVLVEAVRLGPACGAQLVRHVGGGLKERGSGGEGERGSAPYTSGIAPGL